MRLARIDHVALVVGDVDRSVRWYGEVLGLRRTYAEVWSDPQDPVFLAHGPVGVALLRPRGDAGPGHPRQHFAVATDEPGFREARERLAALGIAAEEQDHTVCRSLYFRDPDGHLIELVTYPTQG
ncbi:VOC family protein [Deinococcus planocerae]|uniref:VOC family protein n=1 Tax=Deinococcus planocerae TaxID=1737569 RepID=UPI000C7EB376|nr:VOC family protein [Deinococcus planocerae]